MAKFVNRKAAALFYESKHELKWILYYESAINTA